MIASLFPMYSKHVYARTHSRVCTQLFTVLNVSIGQIRVRKHPAQLISGTAWRAGFKCCEILSGIYLVCDNQSERGYSERSFRESENSTYVCLELRSRDLKMKEIIINASKESRAKNFEEHFLRNHYYSSARNVKGKFTNVSNDNYNNRCLYSQNSQENGTSVSNFGSSSSIKNRSQLLKPKKSAITGLLFESDDEDSDHGDWFNKRVESWNTKDSIKWFIWAGVQMKHSYGQMSPNLAMPGKELVRLTKKQFIAHDEKFGGKLYNLLHKISESKSIVPSFDALNLVSADESEKYSTVTTDDKSVEKSDTSIKKRSPGRPPIFPPRRKVPRQKLWEFIRGLLHDPKYCPEWICWENYEDKTFRFKANNEIAKLWGMRKSGEANKMNFEKFTRAMRYYYKKEIFEIVRNKRLIYKFGKKATGLETSCPNFDPKYNSNSRKTNLEE